MAERARAGSGNGDRGRIRGGRDRFDRRAPATEPLRILVAEDNPNNRQVMQIILDMLGARVTFAPDGAAAVEQWSRETYDIILMDIQMPIMDGMTATREIRRREREQGLRRMPIVAVTANAMSHHVDDCLASVMDAHVSKRSAQRAV